MFFSRAGRRKFSSLVVRPLPDRAIAPHLLRAVASFALLLSCTDPHQITLHDG